MTVEEIEDSMIRAELSRASAKEPVNVEPATPEVPKPIETKPATDRAVAGPVASETGCLNRILPNGTWTMSTSPVTPTPSKRGPDLYYFSPDKELPNETIYLDGLLCAGDFVVWLGREKHRKSNVLLQLAITGATGRPFLTFPFKAPHPLKVVYVDYESKTKTLKARYTGICDALGLDEKEREDLKNNLRIVEVRQMEAAGKQFPRFPVVAPGGSRNEGDMTAVKFWEDFASLHKADIYIFDPMRCVHATRENDSEIELLMSRIRANFKGATIVIAQHMRKQSSNGEKVNLTDDMRTWSDGCRGSGAIKAHSDVIVCQEQQRSDGIEKVYLGAFMRDGMDVMPLKLMETESESYLFRVVPEVPSTYETSYDELLKARGPFGTRSDAASVLIKTGITRPTAFRHVRELILLGLITETATGLEVVRIKEPTVHHALEAAGPPPRNGK